MKISDSRLYVYNDDLMDNSFIVKNSEVTFARINKINNQWCVWFYLLHIQVNFQKLKDALSEINQKFIQYWNQK